LQDLDLKSGEGRSSARLTEKISEERIALFCEAVGAEVSRVAPPTFLTVFRAGEFELFDKLGLKLSSVLHGEQQYSYFSEIRAGDEVSFRTKLSSVIEKKGSSGRMSILVFETEIDVSAPQPRKAGSSKTTVIVKEKA